MIEKCENEEPDAMILAMLVSVAEFLLDCSSLDEFNLYITTSLPSGFAIQPPCEPHSRTENCTVQCAHGPVSSVLMGNYTQAGCAVGKCQQ